ncbi:DNA adenine methylase [Parasphingorhabdus sp.]|uniref:DNA adenine methylase n=1 Tax=Parasphingorhabdus sp. TaxID=2709688 RepID=UPI002F91E8AA
MKASLKIQVEDNLEPVKPVRPVAPYIGGKRMLAKRLCAKIADIPHRTYAEAFVGMGGVFFRRECRPTAEVINDWSAEVHNLFRILQVHYVSFLEMMRFQIASRAEFERLSRVDPETLTDMQRAARFLYIQRTVFGGKVTGSNYGVSPANAARFDVTKLQPMLEAVHDRLASVTIERLPWADFIRRYDRDATLFYLDPPYFGCEDDYGKNMFRREEFEEMARLLAGIKGRFILSINDHPEIRSLFNGFSMEEVGVRYTLAGNSNAKTFGELIISN